MPALAKAPPQNESPPPTVTPLLLPTGRRDSVLQRKCACGGAVGPDGECAGCKKKRENGILQRRALGHETTPQLPTLNSPRCEAPPIVREVLRSPGQILDAGTRAFMEPRFGHDFSRVQIHTDRRAADSALAVSARAYTVGSDIVFGAGQYKPATPDGRRLLAHELTHVVQQHAGPIRNTSGSLLVADTHDSAEHEAEAAAGRITRSPEAPPAQPSERIQARSAGLVQRTPAPPTYGGATGTRDLDRLRVDPVPDFLAGGLVAPRVVNPYVNDPAVTHLTWMLYDPADQMMSGSYSTLPGNATSISRPFVLRTDHFSGTGFVPGKHLLRCVGLNAKHQPVVYTDRGFNVLRADLTTNTALPTTYGDLKFTKYKKTDANPPTTPNYQLDVELEFLPKSTVPCNDVTFIQSLESVDSKGRSQHRYSSAEKAARQTKLAWSVDQLAGVPSPYYIVSRDSSNKVVDVPGYGQAGRGGTTPGKATLSDQPSWSQATVDHFETCAICRSGTNRGQVYGCATWGFTTDSKGKVTLMPRAFRQMPSDQFEEARVAWNTWRTTVAGATKPDEAPALKKP